VPVEPPGREGTPQKKGKGTTKEVPENPRKQTFAKVVWGGGWVVKREKRGNGGGGGVLGGT